MLLCSVLYGFLALVNVAGFLMARHDKRMAVRGSRANRRVRVPEQNLYFAAFLGGWPGLVVALRRYRHKTRKPRFLVPLFLVSALGTLAWAGWLWSLGCLPGVAT